MDSEGSDAERALNRYKVNNKLPKELELVDIGLLERVWEVLISCVDAVTLDKSLKLGFLYDKGRLIRIALFENKILNNEIRLTPSELVTILFGMACFRTPYKKMKTPYRSILDEIITKMKKIQHHLTKYFGPDVKDGIFVHRLLNQCIVDDDHTFNDVVKQIKSRFNPKAILDEFVAVIEAVPEPVVEPQPQPEVEAQDPTNVEDTEYGIGAMEQQTDALPAGQNFNVVEDPNFDTDIFLDLSGMPQMTP